MALPEEFNQWLTETNHNALYPKLVNQINKDFELTGITMKLSRDCSPKTLIEEVSASIYELVLYKFDTFMQLLYRIDVSENLLTSNQVHSAESIVPKATVAIIKREWQKVLLREQFK